MSLVSTSQATVFVGAKRRYFTRKSAERSFAVEAIRNRCDCCLGDSVTPVETCKYHDMPTHKFDRMVSLYVAMFVRPMTPERMKLRGIAQ